MAANTKAKSSPYGANDIVTYGQFQTVHDQAYQSVNRTNTVSAWKSVPLCYTGGVDQIAHWHGTSFDDDTVDDALPQAYFDLVGLPDGHDVDGIRASFLPSVTHSNMPTSLPSISLLRASYTNCTVSTIATATCTIDNVSEYDAGFILSTTFSAITVDKTEYRYIASVLSERGTNSETGLVMGGVQVHVAVDAAEDFLFW